MALQECSTSPHCSPLMYILTEGEIQGTVHRRLLEDRLGELKPGAVLLLKQVRLATQTPFCWVQDDDSANQFELTLHPQWHIIHFNIA